MRRRGLVCAMAAACVGASSAAAWAESDPLAKGPYLQNLAPNAVTVMWEARRARPARLGIEGPVGARVLELAATRRGEVVVDGLAPRTRYRYWLEVDGHRDGGEFATAPAPGADDAYTFVVFGDTRSNADSHRRVVARAANEVPDFVLATGDMVDQGDSAEQWQTFFEIERAFLRDNVLFPSLGNHDRQGRGRTADTYRQLFAVPDNAPNPERYYAFTFGNARFIVLDSNSHSFALTDQTAWLEQELAAARQTVGVRHLFVVMHHPPFSISLHGGQKELRDRWAPLFETYGVAAVFSGHDHVYTRAERDGVRYFVSGGGGASLYPRSRRPNPIDLAAIQAFERVNHYLRVEVTGAKVAVRAVRADGTLIEELAWEAAATEPAPVAPPAPEDARGPALARPSPTPAPAAIGAGAHAAAGAASVSAGRPAGGRSLGLWLGLAVVAMLLSGTVLAVRRRGRR